MQVYIDGDHLALSFPYDPQQVADIKTIKGARWDKGAKLWRIPATSVAEARVFASKYDFVISDDILKLTVPPVPVGGVSYDDGTLCLRFPYERVVVAAVKRIPGITWDSPSHAWRAPVASINDVIGFAESFSLVVDDVVKGMAASVTRDLGELRDASRSVDAEIFIPTITGTLFPYQRAGVAYAAKAKRTFIADGMGLGKTLQAIATIEYSSGTDDVYPVVVVCPPNLVLTWQAEYKKWLPDKRVAVVRNRKDFPAMEDYDVVVIGYSNLVTWETRLMGHRSYVFDESHYCKNHTAQRTKSAVRLTKKAPKDAIVLCLTGTPVTNRPAEYAAQLEILGKLKEFGGLWGFYRRYCGAFRDSFGQWNISGNSNLDELNDRLRGNCYIRRTKEQVLSELPPVIHSTIVVEGTAAGMLEYAKAELDIIKYISDRAAAIAVELGTSPYSAAVYARIRAESNEHLVKLSVLRRLSARAKMPIAEEWIRERVENGRKVVVAAHHRDVVDALAKKFGNLRIQGGMTVEEVEEHKRKFQTLSAEEAPVIVLSIQAAKTGHTLTAAQECLFVELPWTPADVDQTYSRLHRIGQMGSVTSTYMLTANTIDEKIYDLIERKRSVVNAAVDGTEVLDDVSTTQLIFDFIKRPQ